MTHTPQQWWDGVKADDGKFTSWLLKQYAGEVTASIRIVQLGQQFGVTGRAAKVLAVIAEQEGQHADWIHGLLQARGISHPAICMNAAQQRYWAETMPGIDSFETGAAVAAHAEEMRLARIRVIVADESAPTDVRDVFRKILKDEEFHATAFRGLTTDAALAATLEAHEAGMAALGLTI